MVCNKNNKKIIFHLYSEANSYNFSFYINSKTDSRNSPYFVAIRATGMRRSKLFDEVAIRTISKDLVLTKLHHATEYVRNYR